ncbi:MAG: hypothetical protein HEQ35_05100 [Gloeotrichia echinulata IR180]|jgi:hypothetical protein
MALQSKEIILIFLIFIISTSTTIFEFLHDKNWILSIYYGVSSISLLIVIFLLYRRNQFTFKGIITNQKNDYKQIEALFSVFSLLNIRVPIPEMRDWAVSPDFVKIMIEYIYLRGRQLRLKALSNKDYQRVSLETLKTNWEPIPTEKSDFWAVIIENGINKAEK